MDVYTSGQGLTVLNFLKNKDNIEKLKESFKKVRFLDIEGSDKDFCDLYDKNSLKWSNEPDNRTEEQKRWFETYISRNIAANILENIVNSNDKEIVLKNSIDFAWNSLFCE